MTTIPGLDVSNNQGAIDWSKVAAAGYKFALMKASEGVTFADSYLVANLRDAQANGIAVGAYHFALYLRNDPEKEAQHYLDVVTPYATAGFVPALDLETYPYKPVPAWQVDPGPWAEAWMGIVGKALGATPMLYTNLDFIQNRGCNTPTLAQSGLWLASPGTKMPPAPAPWQFLAVWQQSWTGSVPGINGNVDLCTFNGDAAAFRRYGVPAAPTPPPTDYLALYEQSQQQLTAAYARITAGITALQG